MSSHLACSVSLHQHNSRSLPTSMPGILDLSTIGRDTARRNIIFSKSSLLQAAIVDNDEGCHTILVEEFTAHRLC